MIIIMSTETEVTYGAKLLGLQYNEEVSLFSKVCFKKGVPSRLTFLGHASFTEYGKLTPEAFVYQLEKAGLNGVQVIDLLGCQIGMMVDDQSYAGKVAHLLHSKGYNIRVNAFTTGQLEECFKSTLEFPWNIVQGPSNGIKKPFWDQELRGAWKFSIQKDSEKFDAELDNFIGNELSEKMFVLNCKRGMLKNNLSQDLKSDSSKRLCDTLALEVKKYEEELSIEINNFREELFKKYPEHTLHETSDVRRSLDNTPTYCFLPPSENSLIDDKIEIHRLNNIWSNQLAATTEKKILALLTGYTKNGALFRFFSGCWNRHHIDKVENIYKLAVANKLSPQAILTELKNIELINKNGSLAKTIKFIEAKLQPHSKFGIQRPINCNIIALF